MVRSAWVLGRGGGEVCVLIFGGGEVFLGGVLEVLDTFDENENEKKF